LEGMYWINIAQKNDQWRALRAWHMRVT
jgi:hypothetical protein